MTDGIVDRHRGDELSKASVVSSHRRFQNFSPLTWCQHCKYQHVPCTEPIQPYLSRHISIFTTNFALGPPSVIDRGCDAVSWTHAITSQLALPSSMVAYPVCRMCTKICYLVSVSWLFFSFHAHTKQVSLWHIFPLQLTNDCEWQLGLYM